MRMTEIVENRPGITKIVRNTAAAAFILAFGAKAIEANISHGQTLVGERSEEQMGKVEEPEGYQLIPTPTASPPEAAITPIKTPDPSPTITPTVGDGPETSTPNPDLPIPTNEPSKTPIKSESPTSEPIPTITPTVGDSRNATPNPSLPIDTNITEHPTDSTPFATPAVLPHTGGPESNGNTKTGVIGAIGAAFTALGFESFRRGSNKI